MTYKQLQERSKIPSRQKAIICLPDGQLGHVQGAPIPSVSSDKVLVKTAAVALNPTDHKMVANFPTPGAISGCDFAGTVVAVGSAVTKPPEDAAQWYYVVS